MSASSNSSAPPSLSGGDLHDRSDSESGSSHNGSGAPDTPTCPYQNTQFFGHECSRYQDCPTHTIERDTAGSSNDGRAAAGTSSRQSLPSDATAPRINGIPENRADPGDLSMEQNNTSILSNGQNQFLNTEPSHTDTDYYGGPSSASRPESRTDHVAVTQDRGTVPRERRSQAAESSRRLPSVNAPMPPGVLQSQGVTVPSATSSEARRPSSTLNPIGPSFAPRSERRTPQDFALPRWQPDSEVTICPICRTQFSFFVRKHHCRKCGRVVCNACSPHRITIPHQYIVRPPGERSYQRYSFLGDEGGIADFSTLGGGEQVRLCNPCVPDPNTTPPQTQNSTSQFSPRSSHQRSQSSSSGNYNGDSNANRQISYFMLPGPPPDGYPRSRSVTMNSGAGPSRPTHGAYLTPQNRIISGTPPAYYPQLYSRYRRSSLLGHHFPGASFMDITGSSSSSSSAAVNRPLPPAPQIPEEDECPICHRELPSRDLHNFEALRESHIESCIIAHSSYNPGPDPSGRSSRAPRRTGMFPYLATEKDCVDSAECTICLEEFEVGVPMARLECLCRFHRACITAWFVDHPGRCPVHQHDSLGY